MTHATRDCKASITDASSAGTFPSSRTSASSATSHSSAHKILRSMSRPMPMNPSYSTPHRTLLLGPDLRATVTRSPAMAVVSTEHQTLPSYITDAFADGSYGNGAGGPHMNYPYGNGAGPYQGGNGLHTGFGPYPYNVAGASSYDNGALTESRKRAHDQMNDFFGDAKRRNIDPGQYQDLGARFSQFLQMFAPFAAGGWNPGYNHGFGGGGPSFDNGGQYQTQAAPAMGSMNPPFPELRTKNDLMSIDQFLEQLQHTVYDNEGAAQNFQPIAGMQHSGFGFQHRNSNSSPPRFGGSQTASATTPGSYPSSTFAHSTLDDTPSSYQQGHSPTGAHQSGSPNGRGQGGSLYPTLLSFSSLEHHNQFASGPPTSLPPSGLGPQYDENDGRRRYSGGYLQRAKPASRGEGGTDDEPRPTSSKGEVKLEDGAKEGQTEGSPAQGEFKLPSVSEITREQQQSEGKESEQKVEARASWERNLETLAAMRNYVIQRLQRGEYEGSGSEEGNRTPRANQDSEMRDEETSEGQATTPKREGASLYPVLRPVEA